MYKCPGYWHHLTNSWYRWHLPSIPISFQKKLTLCIRPDLLGFINRILTFHSSHFCTTITSKYNTDVTLGITQYNTEGALPLHSIGWLVAPCNTYITVEDINKSFLPEKVYLAKGLPLDELQHQDLTREPFASQPRTPQLQLFEKTYRYIQNILYILKMFAQSRLHKEFPLKNV